MKVFDAEGVLMVRMSEAEALATIKSLTDQLLSGSPNVGRFEKHLEDDGRDFSIAVEKPAHSQDLRVGVDL